MTYRSGKQHVDHPGYYEYDYGVTHYGKWKLYLKETPGWLGTKDYIFEYYVTEDVTEKHEDDFIYTYNTIYEKYTFNTFYAFFYYGGKCSISSLYKKLNDHYFSSRLNYIDVKYKPEIKSIEKIVPDSVKYSDKKIFIVHGHDNEMMQHVARIIKKLGLEPIILHEKRNRGRTIIEKFEEEAGDVGFAVVLLSPDDEGKNKESDELKPRARQNVIFEHGFFIGKLGRNRVVALTREEDGFEKPSDISGVIYLSYKPDSLDWAYKMCDELKDSGYDISKDLL